MPSRRRTAILTCVLAVLGPIAAVSECRQSVIRRFGPNPASSSTLRTPHISVGPGCRARWLVLHASIPRLTPILAGEALHPHDVDDR